MQPKNTQLCAYLSSHLVEVAHVVLCQRQIKFTILIVFVIGRTHNPAITQMVHVVEAHFHKKILGKAVCTTLQKQ